MPAIDVTRARAGATCRMFACPEPVLVCIDSEDDETRMSSSVVLCREHARGVARAVLAIVHAVEPDAEPEASDPAAIAS